ncbi:MAG: hypothetical protein GF398_14450 [Chitinivibrionales bacterium]|nr:hypothetical protein [Chitinivibrionales bacterium]
MKPVIRFTAIAGAVLLLLGCASIPVKKYYILNYVPTNPVKRLYHSAYPYTIIVTDFEIEQAYNRKQIVYRKSPYELQYYFYRMWAVKPATMIADMVQKHLRAVNLVSHIVRRYDEGQNPDYRLSGYIEAIEEYDSEEIWYAHIALRLELTRMSDGSLIYTRHFDKIIQVFENNPEYVVQEMSNIMDYILTQATHDIDVELAKEYGVPLDGSMSKLKVPVPESADTLEARDEQE